MDVWHKRHALQIVMQLPEATEDALLVLEAAREFLTTFLAAGKPEGAVLTIVRHPRAFDANQA